MKNVDKVDAKSCHLDVKLQESDLKLGLYMG